MIKKVYLGETNGNELEVCLFDQFVEISITDEDEKNNFIHLTKFDLNELIDEFNIFLELLEGGKHE
jgi:hypothetical protein